MVRLAPYRRLSHVFDEPGHCHYGRQPERRLRPTTKGANTPFCMVLNLAVPTVSVRIIFARANTSTYISGAATVFPFPGSPYCLIPYRRACSLPEPPLRRSDSDRVHQKRDLGAGRAPIESEPSSPLILHRAIDEVWKAHKSLRKLGQSEHEIGISPTTRQDYLSLQRSHIHLKD
ncbi:hypothetical protein AcW2_004486 [Taiwanofungus camphoratus]|nr:hypothetical protein AcW2_004486 [Antrodia cinnamomea]